MIEIVINMFAEDTYTKVESIDGQDIRVKIMDTCDNVKAYSSVCYICKKNCSLYTLLTATDQKPQKS